MKFDYEYPALASVPFGNRGRSRHLAVSMHGTVDIPEYSSSDIPAALTIEGKTPIENTVYRHHGENFYLPQLKSSAVTNGGLVGLDMYMLLLLDQVCSGQDGRALTLYPRDMMHSLRRASIDDNLKGMIPGAFVTVLRDHWRQMPDGASLAHYKAEQRAWWDSAAHAYMSALILVDGEIWIPVAEPLVSFQNNLQKPKAHAANASIYSAMEKHARETPVPFGRQYLHNTASRYWFSHITYESFLDIGEFGPREVEGLPRFEIQNTSAFEQEHPARELDRYARAITVDLHHHLKSGSRAGKVPASVRRIYDALLHALDVEGVSPDRSLVEGQLDKLRWALVGDELSPPEFTPREWVGEDHRILSMTRGLERTLEKWKNRSIELELGSSPGGFTPSYR